MSSESSGAGSVDMISRVAQSLTPEERARLKDIVDEANLDEDETFIVTLSLCQRRVPLPVDLISRARAIFAGKRMARSHVVVKLKRLFNEDHELHAFAMSAERSLNDFCRRYLGEAVFKGEWTDELGGEPGQRLELGVADIITRANVYEVKEIFHWKQALGQAIIYANELRLKPGLALFGPELAPESMEALKRTLSEMGVDLLLKVWKQEEAQYGEPSERIDKPGQSSVLDSLKRIQELELRKKEISDEMDNIVRAFSFSGSGSRAIGCLRLEETYCTKDGRKYGPYGPYYYLYLHRTGKLEKRYLGKRADKFRVRQGAAGKLRQLEADYKRILKLERQIVRDTL